MPLDAYECYAHAGRGMAVWSNLLEEGKGMCGRASQKALWFPMVQSYVELSCLQLPQLRTVRTSLLFQVSTAANPIPAHTTGVVSF